LVTLARKEASMGQAVFDRPWEAVAAIAGGLSRNWVAKAVGGRHHHRD